MTLPAVQFIAPGEPVSPGTDNRPLRQLDGNIRNLDALLRSSYAGSTVYARDQTLNPNVKIGQPVYLDVGQNRFDLAFANVETDAVTGYLTIPQRSQVWGIVASKKSSEIGDILLFGFAPVDIKDAVASAELNLDGSVPAGTWYLSTQGVGQLTRRILVNSIPVLRTTVSGEVMVNPGFFDYLENHRHYTFNLEMQPAGLVSPPAPGGAHSITNANENLPGWLPATHIVFDGRAPIGARFGYNLKKNSGLLAAFPPLPVSSGTLIMQRPSFWDMPLTRKNRGEILFADTAIVNNDGIWWMTDCYDCVPWPTNLDSLAPSVPPVDSCDPANLDYSLMLSFLRIGASTDGTTVETLTSRTSRIKVFCSGTNKPGVSGDLELDLDLNLTNDPVVSRASTALKSYDPVTLSFRRGPVISGVYSASRNVTLSGPDFIVEAGKQPTYFGDVGISVSARDTQELSVQAVRLDGVTEENYPVLYLGMPNTVKTSYTAVFHIPVDTPAQTRFVYRLRIVSRTAGELPRLDIKYIRTPRPLPTLASATGQVNVTAGYQPMIMPTPMPSLAITDINVEAVSVEVSSSPFAVVGGDVIHIQVTRDPLGVNDVYAGEIGIMQQTGFLSLT